MTLKGFIKQLIPPVIINAYHGIRYGKNVPDGPIWEGVYKSMEEVPVKKDLFQDHDGGNWARMITENTARVLEQGKAFKTIPYDVRGDHMLLPLLASVALKGRDSLEILDWGGGAGVEYIHLMNGLPDNKQIKYTVLELETVCREASALFSADKQISFVSALPPGKKFDIVLIKTALQYATDYRSVIASLCACAPEYFFFIKLASADIPTYATLQKNIPGMNMAHWFINTGELIRLMKGHGFSLIYKSALDQEYDQSNFPEEYRMGKTCNLLFAKS
jgi:putative methyltransferase (TIGR04325 family)